MIVRTNLFEYNDTRRIINSCLAHDVHMTNNQWKTALIGEEKEVHEVLTDCFGKYKFTQDGDIILVNM